MIILSGNGVVIWEVSVVIQLNTVKPALNSNPLTADRFDKDGDKTKKGVYATTTTKAVKRHRHFFQPI